MSAEEMIGSMFVAIIGVFLAFMLLKEVAYWWNIDLQQCIALAHAFGKECVLYG